MSSADSVTVAADFSQFYIRDVETLSPASRSTYLAYGFDNTNVLLLVAARQSGDIRVEVTVHDARPEPLGSEWQDAVEVSLVATITSALTGWGQSASEGFGLGLKPNATYRVRYAVAGVDAVDPLDGEPAERYRLDVWEQEEAASVVLRQDSQWGRHW